MRVPVCVPDHETKITIGVLGPVQKVIEHTTGKETDRIDSHIVLSTIEIALFGVRCDNRDRISFGYVQRKVMNEALTLSAYRDTIGGKNKLYIRMDKNSQQIQSVGGNTTTMWYFLTIFARKKNRKVFWFTWR